MEKYHEKIDSFGNFSNFSFSSCRTNKNNSYETPKASASKKTSSSAPMFTGTGGKEMSLTVLVPEAKGIASDQNYIPGMVQGVLVGDLSKYSAISVLDRMKLEDVLKETESGIYKTEEDFGKLGEITNTDYVLTGNILKTSTNYALQLQVVGTGKNTIGITKASYSGNCTIAEFDNFTGIRKASLELLTQMGISLTDTAKKELASAGNSSYINAQVALSQGIIAQRSGNIVETMAKFFEASNYDPSFNEAVLLANTVSSSIRTGKLGDDIRNDIKWRDEWQKILRDTANYLRITTPIAIIVYDPNLKQGKVTYRKEWRPGYDDAIVDASTVEFTFDYEYKDVKISSAVSRMIDDINKGLAATGRNKDWKLSELTIEKIWEKITYEEKVLVGIFLLKTVPAFDVGFRVSIKKDNGKNIIIGDSEYIRYGLFQEYIDNMYSNKSFVPPKDVIRSYSITIGKDGLGSRTLSGKNKNQRKTIWLLASDITDTMTFELEPAIISGGYLKQVVEYYIPEDYNDFRNWKEYSKVLVMTKEEYNRTYSNF